MQEGYEPETPKQAES